MATRREAHKGADSNPTYPAQKHQERTGEANAPLNTARDLPQSKMAPRGYKPLEPASRQATRGRSPRDTSGHLRDQRETT